MWHKPNQLNLLATLLYVIAIGLLLYGLTTAFVRLSIFSIQEVKLSGGVEHVNREQVALIVAEHLKGNFFTLDLEKTRDAFEKLPWVRKVNVRRRWPGTLSVGIEEHKVLARWGENGLVNQHGELFHAASNDDLPVFNGPDTDVKVVAQHYLNFEDALKNVDMKVVEVNLSQRRAWEIKTDKKLLISLGRADMRQKLQKFSAAYRTVLSHMKSSIQYVDLRYPNGFAVRKGKQLSMRVSPNSANHGIALGIKRELA